MTATERIIEIAQKLEDLKILDFLDQCEKEGYSLRGGYSRVTADFTR